MNLIQLISQHPTEAAAIAGVLMLVVAQLVKKTGLEGKYVAAGLCVLIGLAYTAFVTYVPVAVQQNVIAFASTAFTTSWALYEMLWKPARTKLIEKGVINPPNT